jgi:hypothetical protein
MRQNSVYRTIDHLIYRKKKGGKNRPFLFLWQTRSAPNLLFQTLDCLQLRHGFGQLR